MNIYTFIFSLREVQILQWLSFSFVVIFLLIDIYHQWVKRYYLIFFTILFVFLSLISFLQLKNCQNKIILYISLIIGLFILFNKKHFS